jgi:hypothetical protein
MAGLKSDYTDKNGIEIMRIDENLTGKTVKERLPALVRDLFTFSSKVIKSFIIV